MVQIKHTRTEITITRYTKVCRYCNKRPVVKTTCGHPVCQFKHHIQLMRERPRKTDQIRPTARIDL